MNNDSSFLSNITEIHFSFHECHYVLQFWIREFKKLSHAKSHILIPWAYLFSKQAFLKTHTHIRNKFFFKTIISMFFYPLDLLGLPSSNEGRWLCQEQDGKILENWRANQSIIKGDGAIQVEHGIFFLSLWPISKWCIVAIGGWTCLCWVTR